MTMCRTCTQTSTSTRNCWKKSQDKDRNKDNFGALDFRKPLKNGAAFVLQFRRSTHFSSQRFSTPSWKIVWKTGKLPSQMIAATNRSAVCTERCARNYARNLPNLHTQK